MNMAKKDAEPKVVLEREYVIPLRHAWLKVPEYKRANKAVKTIREFMIRHMKVYDRDLDKIKIDRILNNEIRFRGMRKPPIKIKVKAKKYDNGIVKVELAEIPPAIKYKIEKERKQKETVKKEKEKKKAEVKEEKKEEETKEKEEEKKEKKESVVEAGLMQAKQEAKQMEHVAGKQKQPKAHRMALQK